MKKVYIVGGNGFARECYQYIMWANEVNKNIDYEFAGFLGHGGFGHTVDYFELQKYYKGEVSEHEFLDDEYVMIGVAYPELRKKIYKELKERNLIFFNFIPPLVDFSYSAEIGEANIFVAPCYPGPNSKIGNCNVFNGDVVIGHDVEIGDFNFLGGRTNILGGVKIGNSNTIGVGSAILPNAKIGDNNKIAPMSCVYKGCKNNCYMQGNPALKVGDVE
ncbi:MAG: transferase [bacterium]|nr:transferase [bacterium]